MMWISLLLVMFYGSPLYWFQVDALYDQGCQVYNEVYVSCPAALSPPPGAVWIPADAVMVLPERMEHSSQRNR